MLIVILSFFLVLAIITLFVTLKVVHEWRMDNTYKVLIEPTMPNTAVVTFKNKIIFVGAVADISERIRNHRFNKGAE